MRGKRARSQATYHDEDEEEEIEEEEEEAPVRRGRRPGKEPVDEDYEEEEPEEEAPRAKRGRGKAAVVAMPAEPSSQRRRPSKSVGRGRVQELLQQAGPGGGQAELTGPIEVPASELSALAELMAEYKRAAERSREKFKATVSRQELDNLVRQVLRHMLFLHSEKPGVPVSRAEVTKMLSGSAAQKKTGMAGLVISLAQHKMLEVFGLEMAEITKAPTRGANKGPAGAAGDGTKHLVLRSAVPPSLLVGAVQERQEDPLRGLAAVMASLIQLSGGKVTGAELWPMLEGLGVSEAQHHPHFGRPADVLDALTKRRYIHMERQQGPDGEVRIYTIGENLEDEVGAENIKLFVDAEFERGGGEEEEGEGGGGAGPSQRRQQAQQQQQAQRRRQRQQQQQQQQEEGEDE